MNNKIEIQPMGEDRWDLLVNGGCNGQYPKVEGAKRAAKRFVHSRDRLHWSSDGKGGFIAVNMGPRPRR